MRGENRTVLVVEDDELMRTAVQSLLEASGCIAIAYDTAERALEGGELGSARCAILDVALPGMSGVELCARMREAGMSTPVIMVTGRDTRHLRRSAEALGVFAFLVKPFSGRRLAFLVEHATPTRRAGPKRTVRADGAGRESVYNAVLQAGEEPDIEGR